MVSKVKVQNHSQAVGLDLKLKRVRFRGGQELAFDRLITTLPLKGLLEMSSPLPSAVGEAGAKLKSTHVLNVNFGIKGRVVSDKHWIYVPEKEFPVYRLGFYSNFSPGLAPVGGSSVYAEISYHGPARSPEQKSQAARQARKSLLKLGGLRLSDRIEEEHVADLRDAYVVYDQNRTPCVNLIQSFLRARGILSVGRWGAWEYSSMEDALSQGREAGRLAARS